MKNTFVGSTVRNVGWVIMLLALFFGYAVGHVLNPVTGIDYVQNWSITVGIWALGIVSGMVFLGLSEIIKLLNGIYTKK